MQASDPGGLAPPHIWQRRLADVKLARQDWQLATPGEFAAPQIWQVIGSPPAPPDVGGCCIVALLARAP
jgi:hypothetical protein